MIKFEIKSGDIPGITDIQPTSEEAKEAAKKEGLLYGDYLVPFTSVDAVGMIQVKAAFELGILSTNIVFSNGVVMPMTATDFQEFSVWFATERNKFFM